jgi:hypothetical protein
MSKPQQQRTRNRTASRPSAQQDGSLVVNKRKQV